MTNLEVFLLIVILLLVIGGGVILYLALAGLPLFIQWVQMKAQKAAVSSLASWAWL